MFIKQTADIECGRMLTNSNSFLCRLSSWSFTASLSRACSSNIINSSSNRSTDWRLRYHHGPSSDKDSDQPPGQHGVGPQVGHARTHIHTHTHTHHVQLVAGMPSSGLVVLPPYNAQFSSRQTALSHCYQTLGAQRLDSRR